MNLRILISCIWCLFSASLLGQEPGFQEVGWNLEEVLSPSVLIEDQSGYLWIANQEKLFRYDGYDFEEFEAPDSVEGRITALHPWGGSSVMVGTEEGWLWTAKDEEEFAAIRLADAGIQAFHICNAGALWIGTYGDGLYTWSEEEVLRIGMEEGLKDEFVYDIDQDAEGNLWVGTDAGTACINPASKEILHILSKEDGLPDNIIRCILSDESGDLYFGGYEGGISIMENGTLTPELLPSTTTLPAITHLVKGPQSIWIGTRRKGLAELTASNHQIRDLSSIVRGDIRSLYLDQEENLWVSTRKEGLQKAFAPIRTVPLPQQGTIRALSQHPDGIIYYATEEGVFRRGLQPDPTPVFQPQNHNLPPVISMYADQQTLWLGTFGGGLVRLTVEDLSWELIAEREGLQNGNVLSITSSDRFLWIGTLGGVSRIDLTRETLEVESFTRNDGISDNYIYQVTVDQQNRLWIATDGAGITRKDGLEFEIFREKEGLSDEVIYSIATDSAGIGWALSQSGKVFRVGEDSVTEIHAAFRSTRTQATGIVATENGAILILHDAGIDRYDPRTGLLNTYGEIAGVQALSPDLNAHCKDNEGNIWIGSSGGLVMYQLISPETRVFPEIRFRDVSLLFDPIAEDQLSALDADENHLTFQFEALWYQNPEAVRYRHQLIGHDLSWITSQDRSVSYPRLRHGAYDFQMAAGLGDQFPSAIQKSLRISSPIYLKWWFWLGILGVIASLGFWLIRFREGQLKLASEREKENIQYQFDLLRSQVNPHFLFNSFNTLIALIDQDQPSAVHYVQRLSDLFRNMLEYREETLITLKEELSLLDHYVYLQQQRFRENLNIDIDISPSCLDTLVPPLTLQMLVENAIKHNVISRKNPLKIQVSDVHQHIIVSNPFQPKRQSPPSTGLGLENIRKRYELLTSEPVSAVQRNGKFIVTLPLLSS